MARRRTLPSSLATSCKSAGTAGGARRWSRISMNRARRPRSSVFFIVSMIAWSTPSAKTCFQAVPGCAGRITALLDRLHQQGNGRAIADSAQGRQRGSLDGRVVAGGSRGDGRQGRAIAAGTERLEQGDLAVGGSVVRPSASCLIALLSRLATKPTATLLSRASARGQDFARSSRQHRRRSLSRPSRPARRAGWSG